MAPTRAGLGCYLHETQGEFDIAQPLIPILVVALAGLLLVCDAQSKRTTVLSLCAFGSLVAIASTLGSAEERAGVFGPDLRIWGLHVFVLTGVFLLIAHLAHSAPRPWFRCTMGVGLFWLVMPIVVVEIWFAAEEFAYRRNIQASGATFHTQPRAAPFTGQMLTYSNGHYSAR